VLLAGACMVFFLGIETRNRSLEDIEINGADQGEVRNGLVSTNLRG
jgi:putative MFS transporter